jgi:hypothetical protein
MKKIIGAILLSAATVAVAQDAYLCVPSKITGFSYNSSTKLWEQTSFRIGDEKKLLKKVGNQWEWRSFGKQFGQKCGQMSDYGWINCDLIFGTMRFNKNELRYLETYTAGYIDGKNNDDNTPAITIGTCSPL